MLGKHHSKGIQCHDKTQVQRYIAPDNLAGAAAAVIQPLPQRFVLSVSSRKRPGWLSLRSTAGTKSTNESERHQCSTRSTTQQLEVYWTTRKQLQKQNNIYAIQIE